MEVDISKLERHQYPKMGVYFLFQDDELMYIGTSSLILRRLHAHLRTKDFNNYAFISCETREEANTLEVEMIKQYKPPLNVIHKKADLKTMEYKALQNIKPYNGRLESVRKLSEHLDIDYLGLPK